tara:strand:+ start:8939 stop:10057 length:1119 start_codon:yes stop_codon:yes gene_type:complete
LEELIIKFLNKEISVEELGILENKLKSDLAYRKIFKDYTGVKYDIDAQFLQLDKESAFKRMEKQISKNRIDWRTVYKYAAILIVLLGVFSVLKSSLLKTNHEIPAPINQNVILDLGNGDVEIIGGTPQKIVTGNDGVAILKNTGSELIYQDSIPTTSLQYNILSIPNGKKFSIVLSEGTKITLNSGSSIKYPVQFLSEGSRDVYVEGEAFFEVSHDKNRPFKVHTDFSTVTVLGTKFNVNNYGENGKISVTLVNGKVSFQSLQKDDKEIELLPGFQGILDKSSGRIAQHWVNTSIHTAWMNDELVFKEEKFENIIRTLERFYNVPITVDNKKLANEKFIASFKNKTLEEVLTYFADAYQLDYTVKDGKITIK